MRYRDKWTIERNYSFAPEFAAFTAVHDDYDGAPINSESDDCPDHRSFYGFSVEDCQEQIDEYIENEEAESVPVAEIPAFVLRRARSPQELADARAMLIHAGYSQCGACGVWSNEDMRCDAHGEATDRCAACGTAPSMLVERD